MRIFLIGLNDAFARSVARYVRCDDRVVLCGVAPNLALAAIMLPATRAELALVDWAALGSAPGPGVLALRSSCPGLRVVCVTDSAEYDSYAAQLAGADAAITKADFADELEALLCYVLDGRDPLRGRPYA